jgi:hypothetical protein
MRSDRVGTGNMAQPDNKTANKQSPEMS